MIADEAQSRPEPPQVVVISGPNGAGKSTVAPTLLREFLGIREFVNADLIAAGLSPFDAAGVALDAGRLMLQRIHHLREAQRSFAFETTLASRSIRTLLLGMKQEGWQVHLVYLWLESDALAISRVADRVRRGGHDVPPDTVRRRYARGLRNLFSLYLPIVDGWVIADNSSSELSIIADREPGGAPTVYDGIRYSRLEELAR